jgi:uncharacterized membrane protein YagU involved in acid resistance
VVEIAEDASPMTIWALIGPALAAGLLAGLLDVGMAALINQVSPVVVLKAIAAGLLGKAAFAGAGPVAVLGLALQIMMSVLIAVIYVLAAWHLPQLIAHPWLWGAAYGVAIFVVMNALVVPLSAYPKLPEVTPYWVASNLAAMLIFGLIVSTVAKAWR